MIPGGELDDVRVIVAGRLPREPHNAPRRLAGLSAEQIRQYLEQLTEGQSAKPRKRRRNK